MTWVLVTIASCVVALAAAVVCVTVLVRERRSFASLPGAFPCRVRVVSGGLAGFPRWWRGRPQYAAWVHDVLLLHRGLLPAVTIPIPARLTEDAVVRARQDVVTRLGPAPVTLRLRLDDGTVLELAAPASAHSLIVGPFLAAAMVDLPSQPSDTSPPGG